MATPNTCNRRYSFAELVLDVDRGALLKDGTEVKLRPQSFSVLRHLVEHGGRLVSRDELLEVVWGNTVVTDSSLTQCLIDVRKAIGDDSRQLIRTVPRRGYIFEAPVEVVDTRSVPASALRERSFAPWHWTVAFFFALVFAAAAAWWVVPRTGVSDAPRDAARPNSIAVLPFVDMSEAHDQDYFSDGISEEILNTLAQSPELHVIARTSSFSFKGKDADIATIADRLNVAYVLEGSVRRSGNRMRITAQLVDAASSRNVWSETYDHEAGDVLSTQSEIAAAVAEALNTALSYDRVSRTLATNPEAYEHYLQGRFFHNRRAPGDSRRAESHYRQALEIDPTDARAWAGLAGAYIVQIFQENAAAGSIRVGLGEAVEQALAHGSDLAEAHVRAGQYFWHTGQFERSAEHARKALLLGPDDPLVLSSTAGVSVFHGRLELAIDQYERAIDVDPLSAVLHINIAHLLAAAGRFEEALAEQRKALDLNPAYAPEFDVNVGFIFIAQHRLTEAEALVRRWPEGIDRDMGLAMIYAALGRPADADAALGRLSERQGAEPARRVAEVHAWRGETEESFRWLEKGRALGRADTLAQRGDWTHNARVSPFFIPLRDDPRWERVLAWEE